MKCAGVSVSAAAKSRSRGSPPGPGAMSRLCCYWLCCYSEAGGRGPEVGDSPSDSAGSVEAAADGADPCCAGGSLSVTSAASALLSLAVVAVAVSTGQWLLTEEKLARPLGQQHGQGGPRQQQQQAAPNGTEPREPDVKLTYSGLWRVCVALGKSLSGSARRWHGVGTARRLWRASRGRELPTTCGEYHSKSYIRNSLLQYFLMLR